MGPTDGPRPRRPHGATPAHRPRVRRAASTGLIVVGLVVAPACTGESTPGASGAAETSGGSDLAGTTDTTDTTSDDQGQAETGPADVGTDALLRAAQAGDDEAVRSLLAAGVDPEDPALHTPPVLAASRNGHGSIVDVLLAGGASPDPMDDGGPLSAAASTGRADIVERLLEAGADVDAVDSTGWSPLMWAAYAGQLPSVRLLLDQGADRAVRATVGEFDGATALDLAVAVGHDDVVRLLEG